MKKLILFLTLLFVGIGSIFEASAQYSPSNNLNYVKLLKVPPTGSAEDSVMVYDGSDSFIKMIPKSSVTAGKESLSNKTSTVSGYSEILYPNEKAVHDGLNMKLNISDLPTNLTLYPTTTASDVGGYVVMVTDIHDVRFDETAVDVSTPTITTTDQLVSQRISDPGILIGQPGVFNITTFGNIRRLSGTGTATFYFRVYHRDLAGTETLIGQSSNSAIVSSSSYIEFSAAMVWDDGDFEATDRIVIKTYANRIPGNSDPVYQFQFGGLMPVRTLLPVPFSVVDAGYELKENKSNTYTVDGTGTKYYTVDYLNSKIPTEYAKVVYVNATSPITATIFDLNNPPTINDNLLKNDTSNLYIGTDASTWVYNGSTYVTKIVTSSTSNFNLYGTTTDAGNSKTASLYRDGEIFTGGAVRSSTGFTGTKNGSNTIFDGPFFALRNLAYTEVNLFQLNASNGLDLWNYAGSTWSKRFTFSDIGNLTLYTAPTTSAGTYDFLTRNTSTGVVEKIASNTIATLTSPVFTTPRLSSTSTTGYVWTATDALGNGSFQDKILPVTETGTSFSLTDAYNGKVVIFTASCTVTIPNSLIANFECSFVTLTGVTLTVATGGSVVLHNNVGTTLAEKLSATIKQRTTANNYIVVGSL